MTDPQPDSALVAAFKGMSTPNVSDALDRLGIAGGCLGLTPIVHGVSFAGAAYTVHYVPCGTVKGTVGDFLDDVAPGQVVVIDNAGRTYCTVWGDLMTISAHHRGIAGTVIDGVCRDVPKVRELKYPIFTRGHYMVTGKDRVQVDGINVPVSLSGIQVKPGDIVMADDSGVLVIPLERAAEVLAAAKEIAEAEDFIEQALEKGDTLREARNRFGYHKLQSRR